MVEKAHGQIQIREYYQTETIHFLTKKKEWKDLKIIELYRVKLSMKKKQFLIGLKPV